jgi:uncharacterized damage-inducible protein DinB
VREAGRIADQLQRACKGDAWFGPSVRRALDGVDAGMAMARPVAQGHTIGEIVVHLTAWTREVTRRLRLGVAQDPDEGDWPAVTVADDDQWAGIKAALDAANAALVAEVGALDDASLDERIRDLRDRAAESGVSRYVMLQGLVQHHAYHGGQISLLKKAAGG